MDAKISFLYSTVWRNSVKAGNKDFHFFDIVKHWKTLYSNKMLSYKCQCFLNINPAKARVTAYCFFGNWDLMMISWPCNSEGWAKRWFSVEGFAIIRSNLSVKSNTNSKHTHEVCGRYDCGNSN